VTKSELVRPADYDAKHFDPVAYLPRATWLAQQLIPDAKLTTFEFDPVFSDGNVDLTRSGRDRTYEFRSPSMSKLPPGHPRNMPLERRCRVSIELAAKQITARVLTSDDCKAPLVRIPRCSFAQVWAKAKKAGVPGDVASRIGWLSDNTWFFDTGLDGEGGGVSTLQDDC